MEINQGFLNANFMIAITIYLLCYFSPVESEIYEINKNVIVSQPELVSTSQFLATSTTIPTTNRNKSNKLRYQELWYEINDSAVLNCTLRVNKDQHVIWHRKYDKVGVHVLTIGSETFISDLRIRPVRQQYNKNNELISTSAQDRINPDFNYIGNEDSIKYTWNLEIRRLRKEDSALYYCVLNSENMYGRIHRINVLAPLKILNKSEIFFDAKRYSNHLQHHSKYQTQKQKPVVLVCKYDDIIENSKDQIKWYFNRQRIKNSLDKRRQIGLLLKNRKNLRSTSTTPLFKDHLDEHQEDENVFTDSHNYFTVIQTTSFERNETISSLYIHDFNPKFHSGKYKCQYKGITKTVRITSNLSKNETLTHKRLLYKQFATSASYSPMSNEFFIKITLAIILVINVEFINHVI